MSQSPIHPNHLAGDPVVLLIEEPGCERSDLFRFSESSQRMQIEGGLGGCRVFPNAACQFRLYEPGLMQFTRIPAGA